jgi:hypothetical protein
VREGRVDERNYAWRSGMARWERMGDIAELAVLFTDPPPMKTLGALQDEDDPEDDTGSQSTSLLGIADELGSEAALDARPATPAALAPVTESPPLQVPEGMRAELAALSQELSVVERSKRKRWIWIAVGLAAAGAIAAIVVLGPLQQEPLVSDVAVSTHKPYDEELRRETPKAMEPAPSPTDEADPAAPVSAGSETGDEARAGEEPVTATGDAPADDDKHHKANGQTGRKLSLVVPTPDPEGLEKTRERMATLAEDEVGKREAQVVFDPAAASRKAVAEDAAKDKASPEALSEQVASAFGKKRTQFAKCGDTTQERVKVVFTVQPDGKTANAAIDGTASDVKARCIRAILDRSLFPAGEAALTYSQTLVL